MAVAVLMPRMGYDMQEARVVQWLKAEGDQVSLGEDIAEIETDKAIIPMPSVGSGTLLKIIVPEGDTVPVGQVLAVLGQPGEEVPADLLTAAPTAGASQSAAPAPEAETVPLSRMRQAIARLTTRSKVEIPHFYMSVDVAMDSATALRGEVNPVLQPQGVRLSINDMIVKACALGLEKYPTLNASFTDDALEYHSSVNIGMVIDMEGQGIIVPAIMDCQDKSVVDIAVAGRDLVNRARANNLRAEELTGSTFSISNLGSLGVDSFSAVIHPPNAAVLAVGTIRQRPVVRDEEIVVGRVMNITLSTDHRVEDGVIAARFLAEVKRLLEHPANLLPEELQ